MARQPPRDPRSSRTPRGAAVLVPIAAGIVVVLLLLWALAPRNSTMPANDTTNAGPSTKTDVPRQSPSTSPTPPTPNPTTEQPNTSPAK